jgi:putative nucleotidyltransferase with HDIG domain
LRLSRLTPIAITLLRAARSAAGKQPLLLVGGAVRDGRLRRPVVDVDLAVPSGALALARAIADGAGGAFVELDAARGAGRVIVDGAYLDVTDFRAPTLAGDLAARDFTVNAMAVDVRALLAHGRARIIDPTGGLADLAARRLRLAGSGVLADDPVRALRGVRLEIALGLRLAPAAARAIRAMAPRVANVSAERVRDELLAMLAGSAAVALRRLDALGLLAVVLPEVEAMRGTAQPAPHQFPVLEHSLRAVAGADTVTAAPHRLVPFGEELQAHLAQPLGGGVDRARVLKLGALLHDVSKPETRRLIDGRVRFFEHDVLGAARARAVGERLRLPERAVAVLERLVRHHLRPMHLAQAGAVSARARYRFYRDLGADTRDLLLLTLVDAAAVTGRSPLALWPHAALIQDLLAGFQEQRREAAAPPLVRGDDVMHRFGIPPGPAVGHLLERAREAQALGLVRTREEALAYLDSPRGDL